jgi:hypothetical protein
MVLTQEVLFIDVPLRAVRCRALARAPEFGEQKTVIAIDHADIGIKELLLRDMTLIDVGNLESIQVLQ